MTLVRIQVIFVTLANWAPHAGCEALSLNFSELVANVINERRIQYNFTEPDNLFLRKTALLISGRRVLLPFTVEQARLLFLVQSGFVLLPLNLCQDLLLHEVRLVVL